jgi:hypothetical protein
MNLYTVPRARMVPALMPGMQAAKVIVISGSEYPDEIVRLKTNFSPGGANLPGLHLYNKLVQYFIVRVQSLKECMLTFSLCPHEQSTIL